MSDWTARQYRVSRWAVGLGLVFLLAMSFAAHSQPMQPQPQHHPAKDAPIHEKFYSDWDRPDYLGNLCCSKKDCYPTEVRLVKGEWFALKRRFRTGAEEDSDDYDYYDPKDPNSWVPIPAGVIENNQRPGHKAMSRVTSLEFTMREPRDSPDGRNHVCMRDMLGGSESGESWYVFCAVLGNLM